MTGGIAYVLDETGEFAQVRCNRAGVDLEPVTNCRGRACPTPSRTRDEGTVRRLTDPPTDSNDADLIEFLIARHEELTGSPRAKWILDNWEAMLPKFIKVFPHEYKRVLGVPRASATLAPAHASAQQSTREVLRG